MGRDWWCECGSWKPWSWEVMSIHNSQHLIDPYTFTHIEHGIAFFWLFTLIAGSFLSPASRFVGAIGLESLWEVIENMDWVIRRYREETIALNYFGDSIFNSLGDIGACALGLWIASRLHPLLSAGIFLLTELLLAWWIRDSLLLNILMLLWPLESVRVWQSG